MLQLPGCSQLWVAVGRGSGDKGALPQPPFDHAQPDQARSPPPLLLPAHTKSVRKNVSPPLSNSQHHQRASGWGVPEVDSGCRLSVVPLFRGISRFESLI